MTRKQLRQFIAPGSGFSNVCTGIPKLVGTERCLQAVLGVTDDRPPMLVAQYCDTMAVEFAQLALALRVAHARGEIK